MSIATTDDVTETPPSFTAVNAGHTDEQRDLILSGAVKLGDKRLDVPVDTMTDSEKLSELVIHARNMRDGLESIVAGMENSPVMKMISGGGGPFGALFGR